MKSMLAFILFFFIVFSFEATAQLNFTETNNGGFLQFGDVNGKSLWKSKYDPSTEGTPFVNSEWEDADIITSSGELVKKVKVKLNIESNELYYLDAANTTWVALDGKVKKISYVNLFSKESIRYVFKNGYPAIDKQNKSYYYQVLSEGKIDLLKNNYKTIETFKNELSGDKRKEFVEGSSYYIFSEMGIKQLQNSKEYLLELMKDNEEIMKQFIETNKISFKKIPDLQKVINYYNELK